VTSLARKGGQTLGEAVKRMIDALFSDNLCRQMNWTGTSNQDEKNEEKIEFRRLKCRLALESMLLLLLYCYISVVNNNICI
jgi:hypothetical protein